MTARSAWRQAFEWFTAGPTVEAPTLDLTPQASILDRLMPLDQCDDEAADRSMLHGRNMVPDERWNGLSS